MEKGFILEITESEIKTLMHSRAILELNAYMSILYVFVISPVVSVILKLLFLCMSAVCEHLCTCS